MKAILTGATGLVGKSLSDQLFSSNSYHEIDHWVRHPSMSIDQKFTEMVISFDEIPDIPSVKADNLFCCLGTTIRKAKTREAFKKVDFTYVLSLAKLAERSEINCFLVISSVGANPASRNFYLRTKGEMEEAVKACNIPSIYIFRPSLLLGKRNEARAGETIGKVISAIGNPFLLGSLKKYRGIQAATVARAMVRCALEAKQGIHLLQSDEIQKIGKPAQF